MLYFTKCRGRLIVTGFKFTVKKGNICVTDFSAIVEIGKFVERIRKFACVSLAFVKYSVMVQPIYFLKQLQI